MRTGDFASAGPSRRLPSTTVRANAPPSSPPTIPITGTASQGRRETIQSPNDVPLGQAIGMIAPWFARP